MPSDITTPAPAAAIDRLTLTSESVRGAGTEGAVLCSCCYCGGCACFADDAE
jgi:hypothetical protein